MKGKEIAVTYRPSPHRIRRSRGTLGTLPTPFLFALPKPTPLEMGQNVPSAYKQLYEAGPNNPCNPPPEVSRESTMNSGHLNLNSAGPGTWSPPGSPGTLRSRGRRPRHVRLRPEATGVKHRPEREGRPAEALDAWGRGEGPGVLPDARGEAELQAVQVKLQFPGVYTGRKAQV